ncbi:histidinol-phosphatase HisJ family protein [Calderihabitans maritimus]|uniref:Histidinol-phosphatase n=1 Tax=Calderihabitans maritimus TaxID=1246530 RepID=A0A1Z5HRZ7_9FIRM|nr:histidinol-phosphatase HisJ family protein [Calderihabitans maritimus]GAW92095.1 histidinol-phosphatase HisK [Calderihabitans maritimus]
MKNKEIRIDPGGCEAAFLSDYHVHTSFSADCEEDLHAICLRAVRLGLKEIGVTDHLSFFPADPNFGLLSKSYSRYVQTLESFRKQFKGRLRILKGVEIDYHAVKEKEICRFLRDHPFDFILVSVHYVDGLSLMKEDFYTTRSPALAVRQLIDTLERAAEFPFLDVMAHLDWIKRGWKKYWPHIPYFSQILMDAGLRRVLQKIIQRGAALEINTSGIRRGFTEPFPGKAILACYREMGGRRCVLGSDAHRLTELAVGLQEGRKLAEKLGLECSSPLSVGTIEYAKGGM